MYNANERSITVIRIKATDQLKKVWFKQIHLSVIEEHALACSYLGGLGACPTEKFQKITCMNLDLAIKLTSKSVLSSTTTTYQLLINE